MSPFLLDPQTPAGVSQWIALALAVAAIAFVMFRPKFSRRKDPMESGPRFSLSQQRSVEQQMQNLLVELSDMARQITAQLDTRAAKLEALIKEADEKIAALRALSSTSPATAPAPPLAVSQSEAPIPETPPPPPRYEPPPLDPRNQQIYDLADEGRTLLEIARETGRSSGEVELILALRARSSSTL